MSETSTTTNTPADVIHTALDIAPSAAPRPQVEIRWHDCDETALRTIMAAFPDAGWRPQQGGGTEWISAHVGPVYLTAFAANPDPKPARRLDTLFPQVSA